jgi:hypothetical protein
MQIIGQVDAILGFSYDEESKASCKKLVKVNRRTPNPGSEDTITDVTEEWKAIDFDLDNYPWRSTKWSCSRYK